MSQPGDDAQRDMEQRALRNVRGLLDKIEDQEKADRWTLRQFTVVAGIVVVVLALALAAFVVMKKPAPMKSITVQPPPAKTQPR